MKSKKKKDLGLKMSVKALGPVLDTTKSKHIPKNYLRIKEFSSLCLYESVISRYQGNIGRIIADIWRELVSEIRDSHLVYIKILETSK